MRTWMQYSLFCALAIVVNSFSNAFGDEPNPSMHPMERTIAKIPGERTLAEKAMDAEAVGLVGEIERHLETILADAKETKRLALKVREAVHQESPIGLAFQVVKVLGSEEEEETVHKADKHDSDGEGFHKVIKSPNGRVMVIEMAKKNGEVEVEIHESDSTPRFAAEPHRPMVIKKEVQVIEREKPRETRTSASMNGMVLGQNPQIAKLRHLQVAIENLKAGGYDEAAARLSKELETAKKKMAEHSKARDLPAPHPRVVAELGRLRKDVDALKKQMEVLLKQSVEHDGKTLRIPNILSPKDTDLEQHISQLPQDQLRKLRALKEAIDREKRQHESHKEGEKHSSEAEIKLQHALVVAQHAKEEALKQVQRMQKEMVEQEKKLHREMEERQAMMRRVMEEQKNQMRQQMEERMRDAKEEEAKMREKIMDELKRELQKTEGERRQ